MTPHLTRVRLSSGPHRARLWLRFGRPVTQVVKDRYERYVFFEPQALFSIIRWHGNDYGTTLWQLSILRTVAPWEVAATVLDVEPGAEVLLRVSSKTNIRRVFELMKHIEAQTIDLTEVSSAYWRTAQNRLLTREIVPKYGAREHAAHQAFLRLMG